MCFQHLTVLSHTAHGFARADIGCCGVIRMEELDRAVLSGFDAVWARVQPEQAERTGQTDDRDGLRHMIDQTAAAAQALRALAEKLPCRAARLRELACARLTMARQLQGAYYLLTGERHAFGASCSVRHEPAACLRCIWQTSRTQAAWAVKTAGQTGEPLLQTLYTELAALLDAQCEALRCMLTDLLG